VPQGTEVAFVQNDSKGSDGSLPDAGGRREGRLLPVIPTKTKTARSATPTCSGRVEIPRRLSQLWYDVHGNLLGADFSVLQSGSPAPPQVWGVNYRRWTSFREHVHYVLAGPNGTENLRRY